MAILLEFNYGKKLGLPGYSSHLSQGKQFWARTGQIFLLEELDRIGVGRSKNPERSEERQRGACGRINAGVRRKHSGLLEVHQVV